MPQSANWLQKTTAHNFHVSGERIHSGTHEQADADCGGSRRRGDAGSDGDETTRTSSISRNGDDVALPHASKFLARVSYDNTAPLVGKRETTAPPAPPALSLSLSRLDLDTYVRVFGN